MKKRSWDREATVGLLTIAVLLLGGLLLSSALLHHKPLPGKQTPSATESGTVPQEATDVALPADKLTTAQTIATPLLRGNVRAFSSAAEANDKEVLTALLLHASLDEGEGEQIDGRYYFDASEIHDEFSLLLGRATRRVTFSVNDPVSLVDGKYCVDPEKAKGVYFPADRVTAVSAQTLDDTVYVHFTVDRPVTPPTDETEPTESAESTEPTPTPEPALQTVRTAVAALRYRDDRYTVLFLRDEPLPAANVT